MSELIGSPFVSPEDLNIPQLVFLGLVYAYVLCKASDTISDGSELLLLVPAFANVVGSVVLPVLGAVPDGVMVLVSGVGPSAAEEIYVGVGTLAGSTVMLLTIAWWVSVLGGRVDFVDKENGILNYKKPAGVSSDNWEKFTGTTLFDGAVGCKPTIKENCMYMFGTLVPAILVQCAAFARNYYEEKGIIDYEQGQQLQDYAVLVAFCLAVCGFAWYLYGQYQGAQENDVVEAKQVDAISTAIKTNTLTLEGALGEVARLTKAHNKSLQATFSIRSTEPLLMEQETAKHQEQLYDRLKRVLRPYFRKYDTNGDDKLDFDEFRVICSEVSSSATKEAQHAIFTRMDSDNNGYLCFGEFIDCMLTLTKKAQQYNIVKQAAAGTLPLGQPGVGSFPMGAPGNTFGINVMTDNSSANTSDVGDLDNMSVDGGGGNKSDAGSSESDDKSDDGEDEDIPEELAHLSPEQQQRRIKIKAAWMCCVGTIFVVAFSDPMVDVFNELAKRSGVNPFFVSFILSPLVSNASELVAAYNYAKKKTLRSATISLSTLEGAACMNNTFCLGCFLFVLYFSHLRWEFTCEIATMVIAEVLVGYVAYTRKIHTMRDAHFIAMLFPLSLVFVYIGTHVLGFS
ncbi:unnamed protein product [Amoebophrya sp. A120]|nr:unnamed protein product [Amoebophrya sp. A120]|eukprot:GSA120T00010559001.1